MCGFYSIAFIEYTIAGKTLLDYTNLFCPNYYKKNNKKIFKYFKYKCGREVSLEFRLRKNDETRNYLLDEIKHKDLMNKKYKKTCKYFNYVEHLLILASTATGCVSFSALASLVLGIKICAITAGIKQHKLIIKKKKKKPDKRVLLGKDKLNTIKSILSKA